MKRLIALVIAFQASIALSQGLVKPSDADYGVTFVSFKKEFVDHVALPEEYDLREYGWVSPVRNQGGCGSCWSFSTIDSLESSMLMYGETNNLSTQQLVNCQFSGCGGGYFAFDYIKKKGVTESTALPYQGRNGRCSENFEKKFGLTDWWRIGGTNRSPTMEEVKAAVYHFGAVSVTVAAGGLGRGGNVQGCSRGRTDHMVTIVGWKKVDGKEKYIMKNSWGSWGDAGYAYVGHLCANLAEEAAVSIYKGIPVVEKLPAVKLPQYYDQVSKDGYLEVQDYPGATYAWYVNGRLKSRTRSVNFNTRFAREVKVVVENQWGKVESTTLVR